MRNFAFYSIIAVLFFSMTIQNSLAKPGMYQLRQYVGKTVKRFPDLLHVTELALKMDLKISFVGDAAMIILNQANRAPKWINSIPRGVTPSGKTIMTTRLFTHFFPEQGPVEIVLEPDKRMTPEEFEKKKEKFETELRKFHETQMMDYYEMVGHQFRWKITDFDTKGKELQANIYMDSASVGIVTISKKTGVKFSDFNGKYLAEENMFVRTVRDGKIKFFKVPPKMVAKDALVAHPLESLIRYLRHKHLHMLDPAKSDLKGIRKLLAKGETRKAGSIEQVVRLIGEIRLMQRQLPANLDLRAFLKTLRLPGIMLNLRVGKGINTSGTVQVDLMSESPYADVLSYFINPKRSHPAILAHGLKQLHGRDPTSEEVALAYGIFKRELRAKVPNKDIIIACLRYMAQSDVRENHLIISDFTRTLDEMDKTGTQTKKEWQRVSKVVLEIYPEIPSIRLAESLKSNPDPALMKLLWRFVEEAIEHLLESGCK